MQMMLFIALGGAVGAISRYSLTLWLAPLFKPGIPWATFIINVIGSFLIGVIYILISEKGILPVSARPLLITGFLGALTTYSSFALESVALFERELPLQALLYMMSSVFCTVIAAALGIWLMRLIFNSL
ncbi:fluoride efflux transporter CrcB [Pokkaliibacter sp. CJK22405]|uniref:fluoride efflux transporter CrcB n=1 Tax=Pokkaliibacter sp. CJK22405 TaxID=3384615 RepID=UPI0039855214